MINNAKLRDIDNKMKLEIVNTNEDFDCEIENALDIDIDNNNQKNTKEDIFFDIIFNIKDNYIDLNEWIESNNILEINFDYNVYKKSLNINDNFYQSYFDYIKNLNKILEELVYIENLEKQNNKEEKVGVIFENSKKENDIYLKEKNINILFEKVINVLENFLNKINEIKSDNIQFNSKKECFNCILNILECLRSNLFCIDIRFKPEQLINWVNRFDPKPYNDIVESVMVYHSKPYLHPQFWNTYIAQLLTRGLFNKIEVALSHSKYQELKTEFVDLFEVIEDFRLLVSSYNDLVLKDQFYNWKLSVCEFRDLFSKVRKTKLSLNHQIILSQIFDLVCILSGMTKTISSYCGTWYEMFACLSLFQIRNKIGLFFEYFTISIEEKPVSLYNFDKYSKVEKCFFDILEENFITVIRVLHDFDSNTASYISKFLEVKRYLRNYYLLQNNNLNILDGFSHKTISEYFLIKSAYECLNIHDLARVGILILKNDKLFSSKKIYKNNLKVISDFFPKYHCVSKSDLDWCLSICYELNLYNTVQEINFKHGLESSNQGKIIEALNLFVNCFELRNDKKESQVDALKQIHHVVWDLIFQDSLLNNRPTKNKLINEIITKKSDQLKNLHPIIKQCISPYGVLYQFYKSLEDSKINDFKKMENLKLLLRFSHLPKKFYPLLLCQFLPFFVKNTKFKISDLTIIIELINTYEDNYTNEEMTEGELLYQYSINNKESYVSFFDWRFILNENSIRIPKNIPSLLLKLRNEITTKIAKIFLDC